MPLLLYALAGRQATRSQQLKRRGEPRVPVQQQAASLGLRAGMLTYSGAWSVALSPAFLLHNRI